MSDEKCLREAVDAVARNNHDKNLDDIVEVHPGVLLGLLDELDAARARVAQLNEIVDTKSRFLEYAEAKMVRDCDAYDAKRRRLVGHIVRLRKQRDERRRVTRTKRTRTKRTAEPVIIEGADTDREPCEAARRCCPECARICAGGGPCNGCDVPPLV